MYEPMNNTNDGLMNAFDWRLDNKPGLMGHRDLLASLDSAVKKHPKTIFIAAHFANLDYDLAGSTKCSTGIRISARISASTRRSPPSRASRPSFSRIARTGWSMGPTAGATCDGTGPHFASWKHSTSISTKSDSVTTGPYTGWGCPTRCCGRYITGTHGLSCGGRDSVPPRLKYVRNRLLATNEVKEHGKKGRFQLTSNVNQLRHSCVRFSGIEVTPSSITRRRCTLQSGNFCSNNVHSCPNFWA